MGDKARTGRGGARPRRTGPVRAGASRTGAGRTRASRAGAGQSKTGKPRPGTGGNGRRALEGKGPTPPAAMRPGHPAQRRPGSSTAADGPRTGRQDDGPGSSLPSFSPSSPYRSPGSSRSPGSARSSGSARTPGSARSFGPPRSFGAPASAGASGASGASGRAPRGAGDAAEFVAGRNSVVESLRAGVPSAALYVGSRMQHDDRVSEAI